MIFVKKKKMYSPVKEAFSSNIWNLLNHPSKREEKTK
jgi:hypothetical protein